MVAGEKIVSLDQLAARAAAARTDQQKVSLCHGVFDQLHVGHIRHLQQARQMGDLLVVTITPDRFLEKSPQRPSLPEALRAETVAALDCVDLVAVNGWLTAVETIDLLKPHCYVKGSDYQGPAGDAAGTLAQERQAIEAVGGRLAFTHNTEFSSARSLNQYMSALSAEARDYLGQLSDRYPTDEILAVFQRLRELDVLVVGESIIDEYKYCHAIGKSSKSPTLVVQAEGEERFAGGALAIANNVAGFCGKVTVLSQLGSRDSHEDFIRSQLRPNVEPVFLYRRESPTIVKRRFVESYFFAKMFEVYEINDSVLDAGDNQAFCRILSAQAARHDLTIVADFGHSMLTPEAVDIVCHEPKFLAVNTQANAGSLGYHRISKYPRADYLCVAENEMRMEAGDMQGDLHQIVRSVAGERYRRVVTTCGNQGALCYSAGGEMVDVPALATLVTDRIGAGDAFLSLSAPCVFAGVPMEMVGFLGNVAGAEAVATVGHRTYLDAAGITRHIEALLR